MLVAQKIRGNICHQHNTSQAELQQLRRVFVTPQPRCSKLHQRAASRSSPKFYFTQPKAITEEAVNYLASEDNIGLIIFNIMGSLGMISAVVLASLYNIECGRRAARDVEIETLQAEIMLQRLKADDKAEEIRKKLQHKLDEQRRATAAAKSEADVYKRSYEDAAKEFVKLERGLAMKDSQLESFKLVAERQIKYLEDRYKELQRQSSSSGL